MKPPFNQKDLEYLRELKPHVSAIVLLLILGMAAGFFLASFSPVPKPEIVESLGGTARFLLGLPRFLLALGIFVNNSVKTFLVIVSGILLGVVPILFVLANGFAIGFLLHLSTESTGLVNSLLAVVPHGVFELPGVLLGASIGLLLGTRAIKRLWGKSESKLGLELGQGLRFFWSVIVPLLLLGAFVEAFITSALVTRGAVAMRLNPTGSLFLQAENRDACETVERSEPTPCPPFVFRTSPHIF
jgi:stage II sporulation protein M